MTTAFAAHSTDSKPEPRQGESALPPSRTSPQKNFEERSHVQSSASAKRNNIALTLNQSVVNRHAIKFGKSGNSSLVQPLKTMTHKESSGVKSKLQDLTLTPPDSQRSTERYRKGVQHQSVIKSIQHVRGLSKAVAMKTVGSGYH